MYKLCACDISRTSIKSSIDTEIIRIINIKIGTHCNLICCLGFTSCKSMSICFWNIKLHKGYNQSNLIKPHKSKIFISTVGPHKIFLTTLSALISFKNHTLHLLLSCISWLYSSSHGFHFHHPKILYLSNPPQQISFLSKYHKTLFSSFHFLPFHFHFPSQNQNNHLLTTPLFLPSPVYVPNKISNPN